MTSPNSSQHFDPTPDSLDELAALAALDVLTAEEQQQLESTLQSLEGFEAQVNDYQQVAASLAYSAAPMTPSPNLKARLFQRIEQPISREGESLMALLELSIAQLKQQAEALSWESMGEGSIVDVAIWETDEVRREVAFFARTNGGGFFPLHYHAAGEVVLVLSGDFVVDGHSYHAGERVFAPADTAHQPETRHGCLLFCVSSMDDKIISL